VSKTIHRHPASKLASADEIAFDSPLGYPLQKRENRENRSINDDDDVNVNPKPLT
jgi:hypothetical protein